VRRLGSLPSYCAGRSSTTHEHPQGKSDRERAPTSQAGAQEAQRHNTNPRRPSSPKFELVRLGLPEGVSFELVRGWLEPGVERHAWDSDYAASLLLIEDGRAVPPELACLVQRVLVDRGFLTQLGGAAPDDVAASERSSAPPSVVRVTAGTR
jgi:hypothetical protein